MRVSNGDVCDKLTVLPWIWIKIDEMVEWRWLVVICLKCLDLEMSHVPSWGWLDLRIYIEWHDVSRIWKFSQKVFMSRACHRRACELFIARREEKLKGITMNNLASVTLTLFIHSLKSRGCFINLHFPLCFHLVHPMAVFRALQLNWNKCKRCRQSQRS